MNHFTPLKTYQGLSTDELRKYIDGRDVYIWGCGHLGRIIKRFFDKNGLVVKSFCDNDHRMHKQQIDKLQVIDPKDVISEAQRDRAFIIVASARYRRQIETECYSDGLQITRDFISYILIPRPEAAINISGRCNIKCPSCPHGNMKQLRNEGFMTASVYKKVLDKLLGELPDLVSIELSTWGEPLMNPDLAEIIQMTEVTTPCTVSTNLLISNCLEGVIKAAPSQMIISTSGFGRSYETHHAGASWQIFRDHIYYLKDLIQKINPKTQFIILYHLYKNNQNKDLQKFRDLCSRLGFKLITTWGYLNPYDKLLDYCEEREIGKQARAVLDHLSWNLPRTLDLSKAEADKPCLCQRIFPIINWDLSVSLCHTYYNPVIASNYLEFSIDELIGIRHDQPQCRICQKHGLHRLDLEILLNKYSADQIILRGDE